MKNKKLILFLLEIVENIIVERKTKCGYNNFKKDVYF